MRIKPNHDDVIAAERIHNLFVACSGSQHIASTAALTYLAALLRTRDIKCAVELGAGIGTITYMLLTYPHATRRVVSTEDNEFCLAQLDVNIPRELKPRLTVVSNTSQIQGDFDLAVIDATAPLERYSFLQPGMLCLIEGGRATSHATLKRVLRTKRLKCSFRYHAPRHLPSFKSQRTKSGATQFTVRIPPWRKLFSHQSGCAIGVIRQSLL